MNPYKKSAPKSFFSLIIIPLLLLSLLLGCGKQKNSDDTAKINFQFANPSSTIAISSLAAGISIYAVSTSSSLNRHGFFISPTEGASASGNPNITREILADTYNFYAFGWNSLSSSPTILCAITNSVKLDAGVSNSVSLSFSASNCTQSAFGNKNNSENTLPIKFQLCSESSVSSAACGTSVTNATHTVKIQMADYHQGSNFYDGNVYNYNGTTPFSSCILLAYATGIETTLFKFPRGEVDNSPIHLNLSLFESDDCSGTASRTYTTRTAGGLAGYNSTYADSPASMQVDFTTTLNRVFLGSPP